ncbi:hypothetical protein O3P69_006964 [Scylla paramamosain]|uniref:Uncharacterized protein n=1 Tax=Scylla paramamosain TaxID=85552 RepID=A0AAW0V1T9_SCYPA
MFPVWLDLNEPIDGDRISRKKGKGYRVAPPSLPTSPHHSTTLRRWRRGGGGGGRWGRIGGGRRGGAEWREVAKCQGEDKAHATCHLSTLVNTRAPAPTFAPANPHAHCTCRASALIQLSPAGTNVHEGANPHPTTLQSSRVGAFTIQHKDTIRPDIEMTYCENPLSTQINTPLISPRLRPAAPLPRAALPVLPGRRYGAAACSSGEADRCPSRQHNGQLQAHAAPPPSVSLRRERAGSRGRASKVTVTSTRRSDHRGDKDIRVKIRACGRGDGLEVPLLHDHL